MLRLTAELGSDLTGKRFGFAPETGVAALQGRGEALLGCFENGLSFYGVIEPVSFKDRRRDEERLGHTLQEGCF